MYCTCTLCSYLGRCVSFWLLHWVSTRTTWWCQSLSCACYMVKTTHTHTHTHAHILLSTPTISWWDSMVSSKLDYFCHSGFWGVLCVGIFSRSCFIRETYEDLCFCVTSNLPSAVCHTTHTHTLPPTHFLYVGGSTWHPVSLPTRWWSVYHGLVNDTLYHSLSCSLVFSCQLCPHLLALVCL